MKMLFSDEAHKIYSLELFIICSRNSKISLWKSKFRCPFHKTKISFSYKLKSSKFLSLGKKNHKAKNIVRKGEEKWEHKGEW